MVATGHEKKRKNIGEAILLLSGLALEGTFKHMKH